MIGKAKIDVCGRVLLILITLCLPATLAAQDGSYDVLNTVYAGGGDPTGSRDSTAAVQAAINAAVNAGGGIVYFPPGTYIVANAHPASNVTLRGAGAASVLKNNSASHIINGIANNTNGPGNSPLTYHDFVVEDLTFVGTMAVPPNPPTNQSAKINTGSGADVGIWIQGSLDTGDGTFNPVANVTIRRCSFRSLSAAPMKMMGVSGKVTTLDNEF